LKLQEFSRRDRKICLDLQIFQIPYTIALRELSPFKQGISSPLRPLQNLPLDEFDFVPDKKDILPVTWIGIDGCRKTVTCLSLVNIKILLETKSRYDADPF
jgi:hypothetical protein